MVSVPAFTTTSAVAGGGTTYSRSDGIGAGGELLVAVVLYVTTIVVPTCVAVLQAGDRPSQRG